MNFDIIIIGAGPAGLGLACSLSKTNLKIAVVEKPTDTYQSLIGRSYGIIAKDLDVNNATTLSYVIVLLLIIFGYVLSHYFSRLIFKRERKVKRKVRRNKK